MVDRRFGVLLQPPSASRGVGRAGVARDPVWNILVCGVAASSAARGRWRVRCWRTYSREIARFRWQRSLFWKDFVLIVRREGSPKLFDNCQAMRAKSFAAQPDRLPDRFDA